MDQERLLPASFKRKEWLRHTNSMIHILFVGPVHVAMVAITFVPDEPEDDPQMQCHGGQEKFSRHLWIIHVQRAAGRAMNGLFQYRRMAGLQQLFRRCMIICMHLDTPSDVRRAQKQESLQPLVVVSARLNLLVPQKRFEDATVVDVLKNGHLHPSTMSSSGHNLLLVRLPHGVKHKKEQKFVDWMTKWTTLNVS
jgi:hypothetical protein